MNTTTSYLATGPLVATTIVVVSTIWGFFSKRIFVRLFGGKTNICSTIWWFYGLLLNQNELFDGFLSEITEIH
jgi:hypothetical protein